MSGRNQARGPRNVTVEGRVRVRRRSRKFVAGGLQVYLICGVLGVLGVRGQRDCFGVFVMAPHARERDIAVQVCTVYEKTGTMEDSEKTRGP